MNQSKDGGAGVGRISTGLLKKYFDRIHVVEVAQSLIDQAKVALENEKAEFFCESLHEFEPKEEYDVIWLQVFDIFLSCYCNYSNIDISGS